MYEHGISESRKFFFQNKILKTKVLLKMWITNNNAIVTIFTINLHIANVTVLLPFYFYETEKHLLYLFIKNICIP